MRGSGWIGWVGLTAASLALGAAWLIQPASSSSHASAAASRLASRATSPPRAPSPPPATWPRAEVPDAGSTPAAGSMPAASAAPRASVLVATDLAVPLASTVASVATLDAPSAPSLAATPVESARPATPIASSSATARRAVSRPRRVSTAALAAWTQPGLCTTSEEAEATRKELTASFRAFGDDATGQLLLDPRLPEGAESAVIPLLVQARAEIAQRLRLEPPPPPTFVYFDQELMKAAACINEDVVAFYDGALHLVIGRADLPQSVTHEYTHHALFSSGLSGPTWAQEGIAISVARESWWRAPRQLQALASTQFSQEQMDELIPYKLSPEQAVAFYVQSALTVECLLAARGWSLSELADALRAGNAPDSFGYDLPELREPGFVNGCLAKSSR